jgi:hypothetical protein
MGHKRPVKAKVHRDCQGSNPLANEAINQLKSSYKKYYLNSALNCDQTCYIET